MRIQELSTESEKKFFHLCHPERSRRKGGERKISEFFRCGVVDARYEIDIGVIKIK